MKGTRLFALVVLVAAGAHGEDGQQAQALTHYRSAEKALGASDLERAMRELPQSTPASRKS